MNFIISLIIAIALVAVGRNFIKKHANIKGGKYEKIRSI